MKLPQLKYRGRSVALILSAVLTLLTFSSTVFAQPPPVKILRRPRPRVPARVVEPPPVRPTSGAAGGGVWSNTLSKIDSGATIPNAGRGSITVGRASLTMRRPASRAKSAQIPQRPAESQAGATTSAGLNTAQAQENTYARLLRRQNSEKLPPSARRARGAAIHKAEQRAGAAKAKADKAGARESAQKRKRTYQTYTKTHPVTGKVYTGRTSGTGTPRENIARRDRRHHRNKDGYGPAKLEKSSASRAAIRGREQQVIDYNRKRGKAADQYNGISPKNKKRQQYLAAARKKFGRPR